MSNTTDVERAKAFAEALADLVSFCGVQVFAMVTACAYRTDNATFALPIDTWATRSSRHAHSQAGRNGNSAITTDSL